MSWTHLYTTGGERLWTIHEPGGLDPLEETVSLRDLSGRVLRQYEVSSGLGDDVWAWKQDMIYGNGRLVSSVHPGGEVRHYHLDHLGTPRRVTDFSGSLLYQHDYLPYGEEVTASSQNEFPLKYTGHERDSGYSGTLDDLDYMHARYYSPFLGRFGRVDPLKGSPAAPQSLNRYAYVMGNPINLMDPKGLCAVRIDGGCRLWQRNYSVYDSIDAWGDYYRFVYEIWSWIYSVGFFGGGGDPVDAALTARAASHDPSSIILANPVVPDNPTPEEPTQESPAGGSDESSSSDDTSDDQNSRERCTFSTAWRTNFDQSYSVWTGTGLGLVSSSYTARALGTVGFRQWAWGNLFRGMTMGGVSFTSLETATLVGFTSATNFVYVNAAFGIGTAIGSAFDLEFDPYGGPYNTGWFYLEVADCD